MPEWSALTSRLRLIAPVVLCVLAGVLTWQAGALLQQLPDRDLAGRVAWRLRCSPEDVARARLAGLVHDVGKLTIPDAVLMKPGKLDPGERAIMQTHARKGAEILAGSRSPLIQLAEQIALTHHERWDGGGYPAGLAGEDIPLPGRIVAVCDVFDALVSRRPYKDPWPVEQALAEITDQAGRHFDPRLAELFTGLVADELIAVDVPAPAPVAA